MSHLPSVLSRLRYILWQIFDFSHWWHRFLCLIDLYAFIPFLAMIYRQIQWSICEFWLHKYATETKMNVRVCVCTHLAFFTSFIVCPIVSFHQILFHLWFRSVLMSFSCQKCKKRNCSLEKSSTKITFYHYWLNWMTWRAHERYHTNKKINLECNARRYTRIRMCVRRIYGLLHWNRKRCCRLSHRFKT